jgi:outer membrane protein assembly factor BamB
MNATMLCLTLIFAIGCNPRSAFEDPNEELSELEQDQKLAPPGWEWGWPQAGRSPRRTGYNPGETQLTSSNVGRLREHWSANVVRMRIGSTVTPMQPVVWRGEILLNTHAAFDNPTFVSYDAVTGIERWRYEPLIDAFTGYAAVGYGRVHATNIDAFLAMGSRDGATLWRRPPPHMDYGVSDPLAHGTRVYLQAYRLADPLTTTLHAIESESGATIWDRTFLGSSRANPAIAYGMVYTTMPSGVVLAFDPNDGRTSWMRTITGAALGSPLVLRGRVFVVSESANLYALDALNGQPRWNVALSGAAIEHHSPVCDGQSVYVATDARGTGVTVAAFDVQSGARRFEVTVGAGAPSGQLGGANGVLYFGSADGSLYALDARDGRILLERPFGEGHVSGPVVSNGRVFVATRSRLFALGL